VTLVVAVSALASCDVPPPEPPVKPAPRPAGIAAPAPPSAASADLRRYYQAVQTDLLTNGLLRTDGGGPDTPYDADDLVRNFERIAFFDEYARSSRIGPGGALSRWEGPVRIGIEFGPSVPPAQRGRDGTDIRAYAERLARVSGHPVQVATTRTNFHVFVAGEDDQAFVQARLRQLVPDISDNELALFSDLPRSFYCFVVAVSDPQHPNGYAHAAALIRAEHPDLVRLSCIHEEIAQGLGLPNDSPKARPSIFNDDDEFALLTSHDELLLKMLYDPRLTPGMTAAAARPITTVIATELMTPPT
jgi:hypothetical protein